MIPGSAAAQILFWAALCCCAIAQAMILRSTFAARRTRASPDVPVTQPVAEAVWAVAPAVVLIVIMLATWRAAHTQPGERSQGATRVAPALESRS